MDVVDEGNQPGQTVAMVAWLLGKPPSDRFNDDDDNNNIDDNSERVSSTYILNFAGLTSSRRTKSVGIGVWWRGASEGGQEASLDDERGLLDSNDCPMRWERTTLKNWQQRRSPVARGSPSDPSIFQAVNFELPAYMAFFRDSESLKYFNDKFRRRSSSGTFVQHHVPLLQEHLFRCPSLKTLYPGRPGCIYFEFRTSSNSEVLLRYPGELDKEDTLF
ncbi:hypothetical protein SCHPADRAFT_886195 [Schizopora paradoxa]|uniref:Uncharacterized protein n=1 Tax=Schizopora paradoxa TaxID=27342 RepID=A0A0H2S3E6_9AGAM|nr:hypothetical protein SCHPADRAFT_886195 [Schizopora paradoxa]